MSSSDAAYLGYRTVWRGHLPKLLASSKYQVIGEADSAQYVGRGQASYFGLEASPEGPRAGAASPSPSARGSGGTLLAPSGGAPAAIRFSCILDTRDDLLLEDVGVKFGGAWPLGLLKSVYGSNAISETASEHV